MEELIFYFITFITVYLLYLFFVILKGKKSEQFKNSTEMQFLRKKYKVDIEAIGMTKLAHISAIANAFIIANTVSIIGFIDNVVLKMVTGFVILLPMIIIIYHFIGKYYQTKQRKK